VIDVFDYRTDAARNVVVRPELRGRFLWLQPQPAPPQHSHDVAGEAFLVLEGRCEFLVADESVICGPGQLIYVDKGVRHSMHAIDGPCAMYLSVTPHVEPTHTFYDLEGERTAVRYDAWRGARYPDGSAAPGRVAEDPRFDDGTLAEDFAGAMSRLAAAAASAEESARRYADAVRHAGVGPAAVRAATDAAWLQVRSLLLRVSDAEAAWNETAAHAMDGASGADERTTS
jgi:quercetin dioxygenase-like cupin family protein